MIPRGFLTAGAEYIRKQFVLPLFFHQMVDDGKRQHAHPRRATQAGRRGTSRVLYEASQNVWMGIRTGNCVREKFLVEKRGARG